jgi:TolB-like protein
MDLKQIGRGLARMFRLQPKPARRDVIEMPDLALPDMPSIAVLAFDNLSGDPEQDYFADGMVEDITTALSRMRGLFVIARNSSFTYKGRAVDVKQIGRELGVRYVAKGSVRKTGNQIQITAQLTDATSGAHLWANRFDGALQEVFQIQDRVAASVAGEIWSKLERAEIERAERKPTVNLDAYDFYLRAVANYYPATLEASAEMLHHLGKAIELDPDFARANAIAAWCHAWRRSHSEEWSLDPAKEAAEAARLARRAVELGMDDALALAWAGYCLAECVGELQAGAALLDRAIELNPNLAGAWAGSGWVNIWLGQHDIAVGHILRALRLTPVGPIKPGFESAMAHAHFFSGRYDGALYWAMKAAQHPRFTFSKQLIAASYALAGRQREARQAMTEFLRAHPTRRISGIRNRIKLSRPEDYARLIEGMRKAGMPE